MLSVDTSRKTGSFDKIGFVSHFQGEVCSTLLVPSESALAASSLCCQYRFLHEKSFWAINECAWTHDVSWGGLRSVRVSKQGIHTGMDVVGTAFAISRVKRMTYCRGVGISTSAYIPSMTQGVSLLLGPVKKN